MPWLLQDKYRKTAHRHTCYQETARTSGQIASKPSCLSDILFLRRAGHSTPSVMLMPRKLEGAQIPATIVPRPVGLFTNSTHNHLLFAFHPSLVSFLGSSYVFPLPAPETKWDIGVRN